MPKALLIISGLAVKSEKSDYQKGFRNITENIIRYNHAFDFETRFCLENDVVTGSINPQKQNSEHDFEKIKDFYEGATLNSIYNMKSINVCSYKNFPQRYISTHQMPYQRLKILNEEIDFEAFDTIVYVRPDVHITGPVHLHDHKHNNFTIYHSYGGGGPFHGADYDYMWIGGPKPFKKFLDLWVSNPLMSDDDSKYMKYMDKETVERLHEQYGLKPLLYHYPELFDQELTGELKEFIKVEIHCLNCVLELEKNDMNFALSFQKFGELALLDSAPNTPEELMQIYDHHKLDIEPLRRDPTW